MGNLSVYYAVHNSKIEVYVRTGNGSYRTKSLKFFWGKSYKLQTSVEWWDKKEQSFVTQFKGLPVETASEDNKRLEELKMQLENIARQTECNTPDQLFNHFKAATSIEASKSPTLLEYAITFRDMWKRNAVGSYTKESGNYVIYDKFIHKLQGTHKGKTASWSEEAKHFATLLVADITSKDFNDWANFLKANQLGYRDSINAFRSTVYHYHRTVLGKEDFSIRLSSANGRTLHEKKTATRNHHTFTTEQLKQLATFDVTTICPNINDDTKQLYVDTLFLMYYLVSRPYDILSMKLEDIYYNKQEDRWEWDYQAQKLINRDDKKDIVQIHSKALPLVEKYKGKRKQGYLLPYSINKIEKSPQQRKIQVNHMATKIGKFLQAIAKQMGWNRFKPTMYTMRHSGITDLKKEYGNNIVAAWAHTSERIITKVYEDRRNIARSVPMHAPKW